MKLNKEVLILSVIAVAVIGLGVVLVRNGSQALPQQRVNSALLVNPRAHSTGHIGAKVAVVEFGDYQCPACASANPVVRQLIDGYKDNPDFTFVFRHFPLSQHGNAKISAAAAEAAGEQGKFWQMNDMLYEKQTEWAASKSALEIFTGYAKELSLDVDKFKQSVEQNKFSEIIQNDLNDGTAAGVNSTPTFFVNGRRLAGVTSLKTFKAMIEEELGQKPK